MVVCVGVTQILIVVWSRRVNTGLNVDGSLV